MKKIIRTMAAMIIVAILSSTIMTASATAIQSNSASNQAVVAASGSETAGASGTSGETSEFDENFWLIMAAFTMVPSTGMLIGYLLSEKGRKKKK